MPQLIMRKTIVTTSEETEFVPAVTGKETEHRFLQVYGRGGYIDKGKRKVKPWITLNTKWLARAGFHKGDLIDVEVRDNRLVITKLVEKTE